MERATGLEPASSAWKAKALPLDDTRKLSKSTMAPAARIEQAGRRFGGGTRRHALAGEVGLTDRICPGVFLLHRQAPHYSATANTQWGPASESNRRPLPTMQR